VHGFDGGEYDEDNEGESKDSVLAGLGSSLDDVEGGDEEGTISSQMIVGYGETIGAMRLPLRKLGRETSPTRIRRHIAAGLSAILISPFLNYPQCNENQPASQVILQCKPCKPIPKKHKMS